jgi:hypothetical protein
VTRLDYCPEKWLPELRSILASLAKGLAGRAPNVTLVFDLLPEFKHCIPDHIVGIEHFPEGYTDDPDLLPEFAVSLSGKRFQSSWLLLESDLFRFVRAVN